MRRAASLAGAVFAVFCLGFFLHALGKHWAAIGEIPWGPKLWLGMASALTLYGATFLTGARSWQLVLRSLSERIDYRQAVGILTISQFAKYLPGNVGHHFGRVLLARRIGLSADVGITSIGLDTVIAISSAAVCMIGALHLLPEISARYGSALVRNLVLGAVLIVCMALLALAFPISRRHLGNALRRCSKLGAAGNRARTAMAWFQYVVSFALGALALGSITAALGAGFPPIVSLIGIYATAWLIGFLVPGAPAGLGVREALLVLGLSPLVGADAATAATALFRVVTVAGDGIAFALGWATASRDIRASDSSLGGVAAASSVPAATKGRDEQSDA